MKKKAVVLLMMMVVGGLLGTVADRQIQTQGMVEDNIQQICQESQEIEDIEEEDSIDLGPIVIPVEDTDWDELEAIEHMYE